MEEPRDQTFNNAIKLLGEAIVPGASLLLNGKIVSGSAHLIVGSWAKAALGPVGLALVIANSYSESTTGKSILKHFSKVANDLKSASTPPQSNAAQTNAAQSNAAQSNAVQTNAAPGHDESTPEGGPDQDQ